MTPDRVEMPEDDDDDNVELETDPDESEIVSDPEEYLEEGESGFISHQTEDTLHLPSSSLLTHRRSGSVPSSTASRKAVSDFRRHREELQHQLDDSD